MERMLGNFFTGRAHPLFEERWWPGSSLEMREPALDVYEEKDQIVVKAELPGMTKDDIQISISDNILTIKGEKKKEEEDTGKDYYRSERVYGAFFRAVPLPAEINPEKSRPRLRMVFWRFGCQKAKRPRKRRLR